MSNKLNKAIIFCKVSCIDFTLIYQCMLLCGHMHVCMLCMLCMLALSFNLHDVFCCISLFYTVSKLWLWDFVCVYFLQMDGLGVKALMHCECLFVVLLCAAYGLSG
jgi:hypothetical protein